MTMLLLEFLCRTVERDVFFDCLHIVTMITVRLAIQMINCFAALNCTLSLLQLHI